MAKVGSRVEARMQQRSNRWLIDRFVLGVLYSTEICRDITEQDFPTIASPSMILLKSLRGCAAPEARVVIAGEDTAEYGQRL